MKDVSVLFVGDPRHREFRAAIEWLEKNANVVYARNLAAIGERWHSAANGFELIVLGAARPGEYSADAIDNLRRVMPLTRWLALLGSWCEGELRSGQPWSGVYRTYWHQWPARLAPELRNLEAGRCPVWGRALTMTPAEEVLHVRQSSVPAIERLIVVHAADRESTGALRDVCQHLGYATVCAVGDHLPEVSGAAAVVWDAAPSDDPHWQRLRRLSHHYGPTPLLATLSFPRSDTVNQLLDQGAQQVLSKPFFLHDFSWLLGEMIQTRQAENVAAA